MRLPRLSFGLAARLAFVFVALSAGLLLAYSWIALRMAEDTLKKELGSKLITVARLAAADEKVRVLPYAMRASGGRMVAAARSRLAGLVKGTEIENITVSDDKERVLVDGIGRYGFHDSAWPLGLDRAELKRVWSGAEAASQVYQGEDGGLYLSAYAPIVSEGRTRAVVAAEASAEFLQSIRRMRDRFTRIGLIMLASAALLGWLTAQTVTRPLRHLHEAVERVESGDFAATARVKARDEVGDLARAFNRMAQAVNVRHGEILENMNNGLVAVDQAGVVAEVNRAAEDLLGVKRDEMLGLGHRQSLPVDLARVLDEALAGDEPLHGEKMTLVLPGGERIMQVSTSPLRGRDGRIRGAELILLDVTEIDRLTTALETHKRFAAIGELAAEVAHQIRNPLGAIHGFADLLRSEVKKGGKAGEFLDDLLKEVRTMEGIVSSFLQYARPSHLELTEVAMGETVRSTCRALQADFDRAGVRLESKMDDTMPHISCDAKSIQQALTNLVRNALEACEEGCVVVVSAERMNGTGGVRLTVEDNGRGLAPEILPKLFAPFVTTKPWGTGLGLSLAKKFVDAHGGTIALEALPRGTVARILLPAEPAAAGV